MTQKNKALKVSWVDRFADTCLNQGIAEGQTKGQSRLIPKYLSTPKESDDNDVELPFF